MKEAERRKLKRIIVGKRGRKREILKSSAWLSDSFVWSTLRCNRRIRNDVLAGRQSFSTLLSVGGPSRRDEWYAGIVGPFAAMERKVGVSNGSGGGRQRARTVPIRATPTRGRERNRGGLVNESTCPFLLLRRSTRRCFWSALRFQPGILFSFFFFFCFFPSFFLSFFLGLFPRLFGAFSVCSTHLSASSVVSSRAAFLSHSLFVEFRCKGDRKRRWACEGETPAWVERVNTNRHPMLFRARLNAPSIL